MKPMSPLTICSRLLLGCLLMTLMAGSAIAAEAKRVLVVHSFGSAAPPFTTHSTAFETTLTEEMGNGSISTRSRWTWRATRTGHAGGVSSSYLRKRPEKWRPDLVVPIGSPAGVFVAQVSGSSFPQDADRVRRATNGGLPPEARSEECRFRRGRFQSARSRGGHSRVAPATNHIVGRDRALRRSSNTGRSRFARSSRRSRTG